MRSTYEHAYDKLSPAHHSCAKAAGARRWVDAVNYAGTFGRWAYQVCRDVDALRTLIDAVAAMGMG